MRNFGGMPLPSLTQTGWDSVKRRFPLEYAAWKNGGKVVVFALTSPVSVTTRGLSARAHQIVLMLVSDNWIPLDSSYEAIVSRKLDAEHRHYVKPMRYDASASDVFPIFIYLIPGVISRSRWRFSECRHQPILRERNLRRRITTRNMGPMDGGTGCYGEDGIPGSPHFLEAKKYNSPESQP
jgi:hypothetical protein